jgi:hypothetical protein
MLRFAPAGGKGISVERRRTDLITKSSGLSGLTKSVSASSRWKVKLWRGPRLAESSSSLPFTGTRARHLLSRTAPGTACFSGKIHLSQIGPGTGASYFSFERPDAGSALYFQNLTALNDWFELTHAEPDGIVAGVWPEVGTMFPKQKTLLPARADVIVSDVLLVLTDKTRSTVVGLTDLYLKGMAAICRLIPKPATAYFDWARRTLNVLFGHSESLWPESAGKSLPQCIRRLRPKTA